MFATATAARDGVVTRIGRIDLAAAACAARSTSAVRSPRAYPSAFRAAAAATSASDTGVRARVRVRDDDGAARVRGVRHAQLARVVQPPGRADGVVEGLGRRRRGQQRDPAVAKKVGDVGDDLPDDLAGSAAGRVRPAPRPPRRRRRRPAMASRSSSITTAGARRAAAAAAAFNAAAAALGSPPAECDIDPHET